MGEPVYLDSFRDAIATYPKGSEYILNGDDVSAVEGGGSIDNRPHKLTLKASSNVTSHTFNPASPVMADTQVTLTAVTAGLLTPFLRFPNGSTKAMTGSGNNWSVTFTMPNADTQVEIVGTDEEPGV